ncbi:DUF6291 domain-containing protein [Sphingobacterium griseoflavum]|uniref:Uncharacterized protein n=1 Tax=Sphingobacterium griseoflavum TaxID=1474952 RepID=A0ABQ3HXW0_9SPHI|nr:DUF6291 domain-containing protein [Sphingobacterium griseoflavum]GHE35114.1 hypothetical protein GCM10017764_17930 [Sphingobacterium griseoflavum]
MAEGKKSFLAYADWKDVFESLPDDKAGKLIKHIFAYVNDEDPKSDDPIVNILFIQIKTTLKRDLKKWETSKENKSIAGRMGNLKRWHNDLWQSVSDNHVTLDQAEKIAERRRTSHTDTLRSQNIAEIAVNDNVNVNDSVNVSVNVNDSVSDNKRSHTQNFYTKKIPIEKLKEGCAGHATWLQSIGMKNSLKPDEVLEWLDAFCLHMSATGKDSETEQEFKRYCASWIASEIRRGRTPITKPPPDKEQKVNATEAMQQSLIDKYAKSNN